MTSSQGLGNHPFLHVEGGWSGAEDPPSVANMVPSFLLQFFAADYLQAVCVSLAMISTHVQEPLDLDLILYWV